MIKNDLVSIIITTHNREDRLEYAVESAVNQTYRNIEIIVVDDNSNHPEVREKTREVIKKYKKIKLIENEDNLGGAESRNVGIMAAKGKYISFLDDDDQYLPDRIEKLYKILKSHQDDNIGLAYCSCDAVDENGNVLTEYVNVINGRPFYEHMLNCIAGTSMWLTPKAVLESIGGFDNVPSKQDSTVILKMINAGYSVYGTEEKLVLYLEHSGERISGMKLSNIDGIRIYRDKCRKLYCNLTKKQLNKVECNFSNSLISAYLVNGMTKEAKNELINIRKHMPLSKVYLKNIVKIILSEKYVNRISLKG